MTTILIVGIGGVGGYFGGLMAKRFENDTDVAVQFLVRGENRKAIQHNGLKVIKGSDTFIAYPQKISDTPSDLDKADYIILCTKTYDLETTLSQLHPCIKKETVILPLLNGLDSTAKIKQYYPDTIVADGCVYIVSRLTEPGVITNTGTIERLFFGSDTIPDERLSVLEQRLIQAGIHATLTPDIASVIWEKFIFVSSIATATTYYDLPIGPILEDPDKKDILIRLITEVSLLAEAKQIALPENNIALTLAKQQNLPATATSSLHSDFINGKKLTEIESLIGYVVHEGLTYAIPTPVYQKLYSVIKKKTIS